MNLPPKDRFLKYVAKTQTCWEWTGSLQPNGYGKLAVRKDWNYAHRIAYALFVGEVPDGLFVLHKCDNRKCVRPEHLFLGTAADNTADMVKKKRAVKATAKLTLPEVQKIRKMFAEGARNCDLAKAFAIGRPQITRIVQHERWK